LSGNLLGIFSELSGFLGENDPIEWITSAFFVGNDPNNGKENKDG
jgi:hypothetical protein